MKKSPFIWIGIQLLIAVICITGWVKNIIKLADCDFAPSYKSEVIRIIGVPIAPVGIVVGFMDLTDNPTK